MPTNGQGPKTAPAAGVSNQSATSAPKTDSKAQDATKARQDQARAAVSTAKVDPAAQAVALQAAGVQPGEGSASGHAAAGSPGGVETAGEQPPEAGSVPAPAAVITPSGQLPHGLAPSPSGPVPIAAFGDAVAAQKAADQALLTAHAHTQRGLSGHRKLTREQLFAMPRASLRAVAQDRGYDMPEAGRRVSVERFLREQDEDEFLLSDEDAAAQIRANIALTTPVMGVGTAPAAASGGGAPGVAPGQMSEARKGVAEDLESGELSNPVSVEEDEEE